MQKIILCLLILFSSYTLKAQALLGAGGESRLVKNDEGSWVFKFPVAVFGGFQKKPWTYFLESNYYRQNTSSSSILKIKTDFYEFNIYVTRFLNYVDRRIVNPYAVIGAGALKTRVTTTFNGVSSTDSSDLRLNIKAGVGLWANILTHGFAMVEAKAMYAQPYTPDMVFGLELRLGYKF